jgi:Na+/proline symporter
VTVDLIDEITMILGTILTMIIGINVIIVANIAAMTDATTTTAMTEMMTTVAMTATTGVTTTEVIVTMIVMMIVATTDVIIDAATTTIITKTATGKSGPSATAQRGQPERCIPEGQP